VTDDYPRIDEHASLDPPVGAGRTLLLLAVPWAVFAGLVVLAAGEQTKGCLLLGLALVAGGWCAARLLGGRRWLVYLVVFLVALSVLRIWYVVAVPIELSGDEAFYWEWARRPDWCYAEKGPGVAVCIWITRHLLGDSELGVRASSIVLSFGSSLLLFALGRRLHGERVGLLSAALFQLTPIFAFHGVGLTPDNPLILFWLASLLALHWSFKSGSTWAWLVLGGLVGAGMLAKYTMALFFPAALALLVLTPWRRQLLRPGPYLAVLVSLAAMTPIFIWNSRHGWVNLLHNAGHTNLGAGMRVSLKEFGSFFGSQLGIVTPLLLAMMVWAAWRLRRQDPISFMFSVPLFVLFLLKSLLGKVQPNWALVCYLSGLISFSAHYLSRWRSLGIHWRRLTAAAVIIAAAGTAALHVVPVVRFPKGMDPLEKIRLGSPELGQEVGHLRWQVKAEHFIVSDYYMTASLLAFYTPGQPHTYCFSPARRFTQYDFWPGFEDKVGYDAIVVIKGDKDMPPELASRFQNCPKQRIVTTSRIGGVKTTYSAFICRDFKGMRRVLPKKYN
jgi:undecaprenyl-diphosphatase